MTVHFPFQNTYAALPATFFARVAPTPVASPRLIKLDRPLAAVIAGGRVMRGRMLPGAVLTRIAASHVRVGTFQYFAARGETEGVRRLADHVIARHYPHAASVEHPYHALLKNVVARQADLVA